MGTQESYTLSNELDDFSKNMLLSSNREECRYHVTQCMQKGITVVSDRYVYTGLAVSTAKGLDFEGCKKCDSFLPTPDIIFFLENPYSVDHDPLEVAKNRIFKEKIKKSDWIVRGFNNHI